MDHMKQRIRDAVWDSRCSHLGMGRNGKPNRHPQS